MAQNKKKQAVPEGAVCQKNQELELDIIDMGTDGEGIGRVDGYTLFVKDALAGDRVRVRVIKTKKRFGYARLIEVIQPSADRVIPACSVARSCGGCQLQHCSYSKQLQWKQDKIANCLLRIGGVDTSDIMEPIIGMEEPFHYRNKAQFPVGRDKGGKLVTGFYASRTHDIIPCQDCLIQHPCNGPILKSVLQYMEQYQVEPYDEQIHSGLVRHILTRVGQQSGQVMVCLVINGTELPHQKELVEALKNCELVGQDDLQMTSICLNVNTQKTNVILGEEVINLLGPGYIEDSIGAIQFHISPLSFYQVNPLQTKRLYETALEYADLQGGETVWDLYCGIGTISLFLAQKAARVCGVEIVPQAIEDARDNAKRNGMDHVQFYVGAAEEVVPSQYEKSNGQLKADVVTLDPPRKGCDERLLQTVVQMEPNRIVYVSCDPATLARDIKYLGNYGYKLRRVRGCDMFGMSAHVETVVLLSR